MPQGRRHRVVEKGAVVSREDFTDATAFPRPGVVACEIVNRVEAPLGTIVTADTTNPWGVETTDGLSRFDLSPEELVEWFWDESVERPWNGIARLRDRGTGAL
jgi:hypothetical protein